MLNISFLLHKVTVRAEIVFINQIDTYVNGRSSQV